MYQKREWLANIFDEGIKEFDVIIDTLNAENKNIDALNNLDVINTTQCGKHVKNFAI